MSSEIRKLTRSSTDAKVAGVCAGIAEYFNIDPTLVRLIFVVATLAGGPGLLLYIILWLVMPEDETQKEKAKRA
jgi:phage shock protein C